MVVPHAHEVAGLLDNGRRSLRLIMSSKRGEEMRLCSWVLHRLCRGRLVSVERREGRVYLTEAGAVRTKVESSCFLVAR